MTLLAAAAVVLLDSRPAQAQTADREVWSATLTVKERNPSERGCSNTWTSIGQRCSESAALTDDDFTLNGTTYTIVALVLSPGLSFGIQFDKAIPSGLTLRVDSTPYAMTSNDRTIWAPLHTWTAGQIVNLRITQPQLPSTRPPPEPGPGDPEVKPTRCACTQRVAAYYPERCRKCAIIRSCNPG